MQKLGYHCIVKPLEFLGTTRQDLRACPLEVRREAGFELNAVQVGDVPSDWKPMPTIGSGAMEIRIHADGEWRVFYVAKFHGVVYVLHVFHKKTQKTPLGAIELARKRYQEIAK